MDTKDFIVLCDGIAAEERASSPRNNAQDEERIRIKDALTPGVNDGIPFVEFKKLRTGFIYLSVIDQSRDYAPYFYILEKISEHFNGSTDRIVAWDSNVWKDVIAYAKSLPEYPRTNEFTSMLLHVKERERASAAMRLMEYGAVPKVVDCDLVIDHQEAVYSRIEKLMEMIGGENALHQMLSELEYKKEIGRFLIPHLGNQPMANLVVPEKPYGYLFELCLKNLKERGSEIRVEEKWQELSSLATDLFVAVYDSQKYDIWQHLLYKPEEVVGIVHEMMLLFNLYTLPQTNVSFSLDWCRFLCMWMKRDSRCNQVLRAKLDSVERIMNKVVCISDNKTCIHIKKGSKESRFIEDNKDGLEGFLFVDINTLNAAFLTPEDLSTINRVRFPIVESIDSYILLPKLLVIWNWYEAVFNIIRRYNSVLAKDIGYVMEDYLRKRLSARGMKYHSGEYSYNGITGEVDFLIEAAQCDAYIESKKKTLSLKAQAGDDYYTWGDLRAFIESQMQCSRLENGVRNYGPLSLENNKTREKYAYSWKPEYLIDKTSQKKAQRKVVKVSMVLKEYGPMQDKAVLINILKNLIGKEITATFDSSDTIHNANDQAGILEDIAKINKALKDLSDYYNAIGDRNPTFFCRLYSMEQIYFLIRESTSQDHFVKLLMGELMTTGTENFWNEYLNAKMIQNS